MTLRALRSQVLRLRFPRHRALRSLQRKLPSTVRFESLKDCSGKTPAAMFACAVPQLCGRSARGNCSSRTEQEALLEMKMSFTNGIAGVARRVALCSVATAFLSGGAIVLAAPGTSPAWTEPAKNPEPGPAHSSEERSGTMRPKKSSLALTTDLGSKCVSCCLVRTTRPRTVFRTHQDGRAIFAGTEATRQLFGSREVHTEWSRNRWSVASGGAEKCGGRGSILGSIRSVGATDLQRRD